MGWVGVAIVLYSAGINFFIWLLLAYYIVFSLILISYLIF
jgi:hypothetical protein